MWFDSWSDIARILAVGAAAYLTLVVLLRVSGKRTLAKLNAFDWVVSVALGSTLATILLSSDVSWSEGAVALVLLAALQFVVARTTTWLPGGRSVVTARPTLLLEDGRPIPEALGRQRVTMSELRQAIRATGSGDLSSVAAVVLETDGSLSVIPAQQAGDRSALEGVTGATERRQ
ncbi:DUF421 domain-containing protein [Geodermatophilus obscurus]|uniref:DUF421 domain-containing protein n=1 Tax=Geodermatophilus obscurus (strain ATCC 25078 / DSM 43160 / JCM 3152 / CCUG 61914 / KCC A-0152 / KCTC 9177 / NBRC 13315 / NRRL B-3577 / G-20) TaxID=526225 RepID=D2SG36_GEOOG|nr:YetF domain-containing protein [Geodermatophilus obscurus]ADB76904.1 protein of unknown function DUF421 [Geodermatophilus obscurus DSM 43160]